MGSGAGGTGGGGGRGGSGSAAGDGGGGRGGGNGVTLMLWIWEMCCRCCLVGGRRSPIAPRSTWPPRQTAGSPAALGEGSRGKQSVRDAGWGCGQSQPQFLPAMH